MTKRKTNSTQNELVQIDLSFPSLNKEIEDLEKDELDSFFALSKRLNP